GKDHHLRSGPSTWSSNSSILSKLSPSRKPIRNGLTLKGFIGFDLFDSSEERSNSFTICLKDLVGSSFCLFLSPYATSSSMVRVVLKPILYKIFRQTSRHQIVDVLMSR